MNFRFIRKTILFIILLLMMTPTTTNALNLDYEGEKTYFNKDKHSDSINHIVTFSEYIIDDNTTPQIYGTWSIINFTLSTGTFITGVYALMNLMKCRMKNSNPLNCGICRYIIYTFIVGVISIGVFLLTQSYNGNIIFVDVYTPIQFVLLIIQMIIAFKEHQQIPND